MRIVWIPAVVALLMGCTGGHTYRYMFHSTDLLRPLAEQDGTRFTLRWGHSWEPIQVFVYATDLGEGETLTLSIPYGPVGRDLKIDGKKVRAEFAHGGGMALCPELHEIEGTVTILFHESSGTRARMNAVAACPRQRKFEILGEYFFASQVKADR